jgi:single stranded DNA-binding protein
VVNFTLAVDRRFKTDGEKKVDFIDIVAWRQLGELCANYLKKGREAAVQGRLEIETYEKDGQKRKSAKVIADNVQFIGGRASQATPMMTRTWGKKLKLSNRWLAVVAWPFSWATTWHPATFGGLNVTNSAD